MYDTLGKYGILSAGATINEGVNVDIVGDLPTACNSAYLISVTNTTRFDTKAGNAGFGATTIDIGAPGSNVFTAFSTNQYGNFGGTSGATPHVAGTVALMHSLKCNLFAQDVFLYPDSMALRIKNYILSQSDLIASLENITVSGARLNVNNALRKLASDYNCLPVGIKSNSKSASFYVYPNPSQNILYIQAESEINNCLVYDLAGKILLEKDNYKAKLITLDVNSFPFGTYIIEIKDFENQISRTIFVKN
jgi:subtilisin family serine protease